MKNKIDLLVMGNEASDLDSMVSAIALAYIKSEKDKISLPLMPIVRADYKLRTEAVYLFDRAGIDPERLIFMDDIDLPVFMKEVHRLALVDHNKLSPPFEFYKNKVSIILDHHKDAGLYLQAHPRIIEPVGSCATLVGEILTREYPDLINEQLAILLGGTILLDTIDLSPQAGRVTPRDIKMAKGLLEYCPLNRGSFFKNLQDAKFNTSGLNSHDLLRKDYKAFKSDKLRWGIASVPLSIEEWQKKESSLCREFENFARADRLDALISMNAFHNPGFKRELGVYCPDPAFHDRLVRFLRKNNLQLASLSLGGPPACRKGRICFYAQSNKEISRKKLAPLLENYPTCQWRSSSH